MGCSSIGGDHLWITDGHIGGGKGDDVLEFDPGGKLLRTLGKPGVSGAGRDSFHEPNAVLVAPDGSIFVSDGHDFGAGHNARVIKFDADGKFLMQWGSHGRGPGQFEMPHWLAMDRMACCMSATAATTASRSSPRTAS